MVVGMRAAATIIGGPVARLRELSAGALAVNSRRNHVGIARGVSPCCSAFDFTRVPTALY